MEQLADGRVIVVAVVESQRDADNLKEALLRAGHDAWYVAV